MAGHTALLTDAAALGEILDAGGRWGKGRIVTATPSRIGADYGLSGVVHRVEVVLDDGTRTSLIAKTEDPERTRRAVVAWDHAGQKLGRSVPVLYGSVIDEDDGLILTEDISPGRQGDDLGGCSTLEAEDIVDLVARLHVATQFAPGEEGSEHAPSFALRPRSPDRWEKALDKATTRYPDVVRSTAVSRLHRLPEQLIEEAAQIDLVAQRSWIHVDPHLDNILWRPDGVPVLLDWSNARIGPPEVDVAALLMGYGFRASPPLRPDALLRRYERTAGRAVDDDRLRIVLLAVFVQGVLGWAGEESNEGFPDRKRLLRDDTIGRAIRALEWADQGG